MTFTLAETIQILPDNKYTIRKVRLIFDADSEPPIVIRREMLMELHSLAELRERLPECVCQFYSMSNEQLRQLTDEDRSSRITEADQALAECCAELNRPEVERANASLQECKDRLHQTPASTDIQRLIRFYENVMGHYYQWYASVHVSFPIEIPEMPPAGEADSPKLTNRQEMLEKYIAIVKRLGTPAPTFEQLSENSDESDRTWRRRLEEPAFLLELKQRLERKRNTAKSDQTRELWANACLRVYDLGNVAAKKVERSRERPVGGRIDDYADNQEHEIGDDL